MDPERIIQSLKSQIKKVLYDFSIYMTVLKWPKFRDGGQISGFQEIMMSGQDGACGQKGQQRDPSGDGPLVYLDNGSDYLNLYM